MTTTKATDTAKLFGIPRVGESECVFLPGWKNYGSWPYVCLCVRAYVLTNMCIICVLVVYLCGTFVKPPRCVSYDPRRYWRSDKVVVFMKGRRVGVGIGSFGVR